jgi:hypothetical protein
VARRRPYSGGGSICLGGIADLPASGEVNSHAYQQFGLSGNQCSRAHRAQAALKLEDLTFSILTSACYDLGGDYPNETFQQTANIPHCRKVETLTNLSKLVTNPR